MYSQNVAIFYGLQNLLIVYNSIDVTLKTIHTIYKTRRALALAENQTRTKRKRVICNQLT